MGFATLMKREGNTSIIVGRDARLSGKELFDALCDGINSTGLDVIDIGLCMTPMTLLLMSPMLNLFHIMGVYYVSMYIE